jgi:putative DNA primase/helicase
LSNSKYFHGKDGIRAYVVADAVRALGAVRWGPDRTFWCYMNGVWHSNDDLIHARIVRTLGDDYRPSHSQTVRDVLRAELPRLDIEPVEKYVNVSNGMVEWNSSHVIDRHGHGELYLSTVQLPITWRASATCPAFDEFLEWAVAADDVQRVWQILGYLMMSGNPLQRAILLTGGGGNGKGVLLEVIKQLLGERNCTSIPLHDFADNRFVTAELFGKLANICGDIDATWIENTSRIKEITGEDTVMGERKGQDPFYFKPWCKMVFSANDIPGSADSSGGWTRRFEVVHFPNIPAVKDRGLKDRLTTPASLAGIALKAVRALRDLMARGDFSDGDARTEAHREFAERSNIALRWLNSGLVEYPVPAAAAWTKSADVWESFKPWMWGEVGSGAQLTKRGFYAKLKQAPGVLFRELNGNQGFRGFALRALDGSSSVKSSRGFPVADQIALDLGKQESRG